MLYNVNNTTINTDTIHKTIKLNITECDWKGPC